MIVGAIFLAVALIWVAATVWSGSTDDGGPAGLPSTQESQAGDGAGAGDADPGLAFPEDEGRASEVLPGVAPLSDPQERSVIVTANQSVIVSDVETATASLLRTVSTLDGFVQSQVTSAGQECPPVEPYADGSYIEAYPCVNGPSTTLTIRLPQDQVDPLLATTAALGDQDWLSRSSSDVSTRVADIDARVATAEAGIARLRSLVADADDLSDLIALESELTRRQSDLESLLAQQRTLANQVALASVTTTLTEDGVEPPTEDTGFWAGLQRGWDALVSGAQGLATGLGLILPFLIVAGVLLAAVVPLVRRYSRRGSDSNPDPAEPTKAESEPVAQEASSST